MALVLTKRRLKIVAAAALLAVAALVAERLYVTDRQAIRASIHRMAAAVKEGDAEALVAELAADYHDEGLNREDVRRIAANYFAVYGPTEVRFLSRNINVAGDVANADLNVMAGLSGHRGARFQTEWRVGFVRLEGRWRVERITPLRVAGRDVSDLKSLAGRYALDRPAPPDAFNAKERGFPPAP